MTPTLHIVLHRRQPATWTDVRAMPGGCRGVSCEIVHMTLQRRGSPVSGAELATHLGGDAGTVGPAGHLRRDRLHDLPHGGHPGRPGLRDGSRYQAPELT